LITLARRLTKINIAPKHALILKKELRQELRNPLGTLIKGSPQQTGNELGELIRKEKTPCIISVGDIVSKALLELGIKPHIMIIDGKALRKQIQLLDVEAKNRILLKNPAGMLTPLTWVATAEALHRKTPTLIMVEGEEDLLTLVAVLEAPENALVAYGLPNEGVVVVKVDSTAKQKASLIIEAMESAPKS
jgi:uncharacterized protein (UPF0218 family)